MTSLDHHSDEFGLVRPGGVTPVKTYVTMYENANLKCTLISEQSRSQRYPFLSVSRQNTCSNEHPFSYKSEFTFLVEDTFSDLTKGVVGRK